MEKIYRIFAILLSFCLLMTPVLSAYSEGEEASIDVVSIESEETAMETGSEVPMTTGNIDLDKNEYVTTEDVVEFAEESAEAEVIQEKSVDRTAEKESIQEDKVEEDLTSDGNHDKQISEATAVENKEQGSDKTILENSENQINIENITNQDIELSDEIDNSQNTAIDYSAAAIFSPVFVKGYAEVLQDTEVFTNTNANQSIGILKSGTVEVKQRERIGEEKDYLLVNFESDGRIIEGYVSSKDLRPCLKSDEKSITNIIFELKVLVETDDSSEKPDEKLLIDEKTIEVPVETEEISEENTKAAEVVIEQDEDKSEFLIDEIAETIIVDELSETNIEETVVVESAEIVNVSEVEDSETTEEVVYSENEEEGLLYASVEGDVILSDGETSEVKVANGAGKQANAYYDMATAGLLTLAFKAADGSNGNLTITVKSYRDDIVWSDIWAVNSGTYNCSYFLEADEYSIIISKSDPTDDAAYNLTVTPTVSRIGELGTRNNSIAYAKELTVGGGTYTGIVSLQDVNYGRNDYYSFTLSSPGFVKTSFTNKTVSTMSFVIYGSDEDSGTGTVLATYTAPAASDKNESGTSTINRALWLDAGRYYLLASPGSEDGRYDFSVTSDSITITENEKDDSFNQAYNSENELKLDGTQTTGLISASDGIDCYYFKTENPTIISFSVKIQMRGASAAIYTRDGTLVSGSSFGKNSTSGSDGNPYELELKDFLVDGAGYYYLRVGYDSAQDTGKYSVSARQKITASVLDVTLDGTIATISAKSAPSSITPKVAYIHIFEVVGSVSHEVKTLTYNGSAGKNINYKYAIPENGNYNVQYVVTDGTNWSEKWVSFSSAQPVFEITSIKATADETGKITCSAEYTGNGNLIDSAADLYKNNVLVETKYLNGGTNWTFNAPATGTYTIHFAGTLTGVAWKEGWRQIDVNVPVILPLSVDTLNVSTNGKGLISCSATTKDGKALKSMKFVLYQGSSIIGTVQASSTGTGNFTVNKSGSYTVQCVAYDGETWADKWQSCTVTISSSSILSVDSVSATADGDGNVTLTATTKNGGSLNYSTFVIYDSSSKEVKKVPATNGKASTTLVTDGVYGVQYVASDGKTWADGWTNVTIHLTGSSQMPVITSLSATSDASGAINISCDYTTGKPLTSLNYYVFDSSNTMVNYTSTVNSKNVVLYVENTGNYVIHAVATDGINWADKWTNVSVTVSGSGITALSITNLEVKATSANSIHIKGTTNDSRALTVSKFILHKDGAVQAEINAPMKETDCNNLKAGEYWIQYVVSDGNTWVDSWKNITVGTSGLSINSLSATKAGTTYTVTASLTNNLEIKTVIITLYDMSNNIAAKWTWDGTGDYLQHIFVVDSSVTVNCAQYVVSDGVEWKDEWKQF